MSLSDFLSIFVYIFSKCFISFFSELLKKRDPCCHLVRETGIRPFLIEKFFLNECNLKGATTLSTTTFGIMTLGITIVARMRLRLVTFSITTPTIMTLIS